MTSKPQAQVPSNGPPQTLAVQEHKPPISIWWPLSVLAGWIICFIAGAGLIAAWRSNAKCSYDDYVDFAGGATYRDYCGGKNGEWYAGIAFIIVALILKLVFWVLIIVRCYQRRRGYISVTTVVESGHPGPYQQQQQSIPLNKYAPQQEYTSYSPQMYQDVQLQTRYG